MALIVLPAALGSRNGGLTAELALQQGETCRILRLSGRQCHGERVGGELRQVIGCRLLHNKVLNERAVSRMCMVLVGAVVICQCHWQCHAVADSAFRATRGTADGALAE